jgi:hypothetical protein
MRLDCLRTKKCIFSDFLQSRGLVIVLQIPGLDPSTYPISNNQIVSMRQEESRMKSPRSINTDILQRSPGRIFHTEHHYAVHMASIRRYYILSIIRNA